MTKLRPYADYKNSGIGWLPEVPAGWQVARLKSCVRLVTDRAEDRSNPIALENIEGWTGRLVESTTEFAAEGIKFATGDVLFGKLRPYLAKSWMADRAGEAVGDFFVMRPGSGLHPKFLNYVTLTPEFISMVDGSTFGSKMPRASWDFIANVRHPFPDPEVQALIASFLDRETAQIDELIGKQQRLIELLAEKRQAIITHAVTKGLDAAAPTKPSGVQWLGDIPAHWECKQIKWLTQVRRGASPRPIDNPVYFDENGEWSWVRIADVSASDGTLNSTTQRLSDLGSSLSVKLEPGSLFVSIAGTVGKPCINRIKACIHDGFVYFPTLRIDPQYLFRIFEAGRCYEGLGKMGTQLNLNTDTIGSIYVPVPPREEIEEILTALSSRLRRLDALSSKITQFKERLIERRAALISAAVTGKIDVREGAA